MLLKSALGFLIGLYEKKRRWLTSWTGVLLNNKVMFIVMLASHIGALLRVEVTQGKPPLHANTFVSGLAG